MGSLATGRDFYGRAVQRGGPSVYIAAEDPAGFKVRVGAWKRAHRLPLNHPIGVYAFPECVDLCDAVSVERFKRFLLSAGVAGLRVITIGTYAASTPGANENSSEDVTIALSHARRWQAAFRCLVLVVHHSNASGNRERGHSGLRAGVDTMISLTPMDDVVHVENPKQRNGPQFDPFLLKLVPVADGLAVCYVWRPR